LETRVEITKRLKVFFCLKEGKKKQQQTEKENFTRDWSVLIDVPFLIEIKMTRGEEEGGGSEGKGERSEIWMKR